MPLADQFLDAAAAARNTAAADEIARLTYRANVEGHLTDTAARAIGEALAARRRAFSEGRGFAPASLSRPALRPRRPPRSPDRARSIERRRRQAASGAMPPQIAANFTTGEAAVLTVVAREVQRSGRCEFYLDKIAALAGVCRSTAQNALHEARRLGLLTVTERRRRGAKSLTNVVEVVSAEWRAWLRIGSKNFDTTGIDSKTRSGSALRSTEEKRIGAPPAHAFGGPMPAEAGGGGGNERAFEGCERKFRASSPWGGARTER